MKVPIKTTSAVPVEVDLDVDAAFSLLLHCRRNLLPAHPVHDWMVREIDRVLKPYIGDTIPTKEQAHLQLCEKVKQQIGEEQFTRLLNQIADASDGQSKEYISQLVVIHEKEVDGG